MPVKLTCKTCGQAYFVKPSVAANGSCYCSIACKAKAQQGKTSEESKLVECKCDFCGKTIQRYPSQIYEHVFCSLQCARDFGRVKRECKQCGCSFTVQKTRLSLPAFTAEFCSTDCRAEYQVGERNPNWKGGPVPVLCENCNKPLDRKPWQIENHKRHFCSWECHIEWKKKTDEFSGPNSHAWKGGDWGYRYGPNWRKQRRHARKRDNYTCQHCGITEKKARRELDVHHIIPFRLFNYIADENDNYLQANDLQNLITLCPTCHARAEHEMIPIQPALL